MGSITVFLADDAGNGLASQTVTLRRKGLGDFGSTAYTMTDVTAEPGSYEYNGGFVTDTYKVWVNGSEDRSFGGANGIDIMNLDDVLLKSGGTLTGPINANGQAITNLPNPATGAEPVTKDYGDARYLREGLNLDFSSIEVLVATGTEDGSPVNLAQLSDAIDALNAAIGAVITTPYQESINVVRLMPGGTASTAKVYTSYALAQDYCRLYPANNTHRMTIEIKGAGSGGVTVTATDGAISGNHAFNNYVSLKGENQNIKLLVDDDTFSVTAGGTIIENLTVARDDDGDGTPQFVNVIFKDCYLDFDTASLTLNACQFRGTCYIKNTGTITFTSCKGGNVITNGTLPATVQGVGDVPSADF